MDKSHNWSFHEVEKTNISSGKQTNWNFKITLPYSLTYKN